MKKVRLVLMLLVLVLALGFPVHEAQANCTKSCEHTCLAREEACLAGLIHPECGGDSTCCHNKVAACYTCCTWY